MKMQKRYMAFLALCGIIGSMFHMGQLNVRAAESPKMSVEANKTTVSKGEQFTVTVGLTDNTEGTALQYELKYSEGLEYVGIKNNGAYEGETNHISGDKKIVAASASNNIIPNSELFVVTFKVKESATKDDVSLTSIVDEFCDKNLVDIPTTTMGNYTELKLNASQDGEGSNNTTPTEDKNKEDTNNAKELKSNNAKTGDYTQTAGTVFILMVAFVAIIVASRKRNNGTEV